VNENIILHLFGIQTFRFGQDLDIFLESKPLDLDIFLELSGGQKKLPTLHVNYQLLIVEYTI